MGTKKRILLYIDNETLQKAKELGLNLSKVSENALKEAIRRMSEPNGGTMRNGGTENSAEWTEGDLNPRPPECKSFAPPLAESGLDYADFKIWLEKRYSKRYASSIRYYINRYQHLLNGRLSELDSFSRAKRRMALSSLIALSKYLGRYDEFKQRIRNFGLRWSGRNNYDCFRRIWNNDAADIPEWLQECAQRFDPTYATFIKFCAISGLRKSEAINAFNLVLKLKKQDRVSEYYNMELEALEHYHYPELFLRKSKNTYLSFIPMEFLKDILECQPVSNANLKRRFKSHNMKCRLQHLRHHWATQTIQNGLLREEADLLQGRIGRSVFMQHYFSPNIQELKSRTLTIVRQTILGPNHSATLRNEEN